MSGRDISVRVDVREAFDEVGNLRLDQCVLSLNGIAPHYVAFNQIAVPFEKMQAVRGAFLRAANRLGIKHKLYRELRENGHRQDVKG
jgi:hypothetical protein